MTSAFPKSARLLTRRDFMFSRYESIEVGPFRFLVNRAGTGRLGISVPKRVIKLSPGRNRIKRLLREAFRIRREQLKRYDLHVIAQHPLGKTWKVMELKVIQSFLDQALKRIPVRPSSST